MKKSPERRLDRNGDLQNGKGVGRWAKGPSRKEGIREKCTGKKATGVFWRPRRALWPDLGLKGSVGWSVRVHLSESLEPQGGWAH